MTLAKVLSTFDNLRPVEDTEHLKRLLAALGVRVMKYEEMFDELAAGTLIDGTDHTSTASRRDAGFGDMGPF